jgi:multidrug efflux system membrane fusion protein
VRINNSWLWIGTIALSLLTLGNAVAQELTGVVQWAQRVELGTPQSGIIVNVPVKTGEMVKKDQLLVQLETRALQARVRRAEAEQAKSKKARDEAQRELDRSKELYERTLLSNHDLEQAKIAYSDANSRHQAASAALVEARLDLEQSTIRAPFDGVVLQRNAEVGQTVVSNLQSVPLITMAAMRQMRVQAEATDAQLAKLAVGQCVTVESGGRHFKGTISMIGFEPAAGNGEPRYPLQVLFTTEGAVVRVGQQAKVITQ